MSDEMTRLQGVQSRDLEIDALHEERGRSPEELTQALKRQVQLEGQLASKRQELDERSSEIRSSELDLGAMQERRKAAANSALSADSAKEISQFQNQEIMFATRVQEVEEDLLPLMEDAERLEAEVEELSSQLEEIGPVVTELRQAEEERVSNIDVKSAALAEERATMVESINKSLLSIYEQGSQKYWPAIAARAATCTCPSMLSRRSIKTSESSAAPVAAESCTTPLSKRSSAGSPQLR